MKIILWLFIDKKSFVSSNELLWTFQIEKYGLVIWLKHHKIEIFILIHIPNLLLRLNIIW
jgi:hypothetical protein